MQLQLPGRLLAVVGIAGGLLTGLIRSNLLNLFGSTSVTKEVIVAAAVLAAFAGPLLGQAWRAAVHLPQTVVMVIGAADVAIGVVVVQVTDTTASAILGGILVMFNTLGFGPTVSAAVATRLRAAR